jgi:hypothetical protein
MRASPGHVCRASSLCAKRKSKLCRERPQTAAERCCSSSAAQQTSSLHSAVTAVDYCSNNRVWRNSVNIELAGSCRTIAFELNRRGVSSSGSSWKRKVRRSSKYYP